MNACALKAKLYKQVMEKRGPRTALSYENTLCLVRSVWRFSSFVARTVERKSRTSMFLTMRRVRIYQICYLHAHKRCHWLWLTHSICIVVVDTSLCSFSWVRFTFWLLASSFLALFHANCGKQLALYSRALLSRTWLGEKELRSNWWYDLSGYNNIGNTSLVFWLGYYLTIPKA